MIVPASACFFFSIIINIVNDSLEHCWYITHNWRCFSPDAFQSHKIGPSLSTQYELPAMSDNMEDPPTPESIAFNVSENYAINQIIGEGAYGVVVYVESWATAQAD